MALYIGICLAVVYGLTAMTAAQADMKDSCRWKCLTFAQLWPGSFCLTFSKHKCMIPDQVDGWTIHGLWPNGKESCNRTWKLAQKDIGDLWTDMRKYWPSLINEDPFKFWQREWTKHGTCGTCAKNMSCPHKYFSLALELRTKVSIDEYFSAAGIKPSCHNGYTYGRFHTALSYLGPYVNLQCCKDKKRQVLVQIKIHFSKDLSIGCKTFEENVIYSYYKPCTKKSEIYLYPFTDHPHNPCS
ncbi:ribonuclease T2-like isoform X1 [Chiloscyllium plagiosum]|uniref:ribonuclease T2-like isoform X1 n=1 Tax=Chiloscyllium plagiosum TaxID=36176 RepID=UPI001CB7D00A|nr:ribonuclease T2-like isoform X1 [Chiloscyllium plagiosum]